MNIPKHVTLDVDPTVKTGTADYTVSVRGQIEPSHDITVEPDASFAMACDDISLTATVTQGVTSFSGRDLTLDTPVQTTGNIAVGSMKGGTYSGNFDFHIAEKAGQAGHAHTYSETVTKEPTCTEDGEKTLTCTECSDTKTEVIPATGHNYVDDVCDKCGAVSPDHTHSYSETVIQKGDCFAGTDQTVKYECTKCGDSYTQTSSAEHDYDTETQFCKVCHAANMSVFSEPGLYGYVKGSGKSPVLRTSWVDIIEKTEMDVTASGLGLTPKKNRSIYKLQLASLNPYSEQLILVLPKSVTSIGDYQFSTYSGTGADMRANKLDYVIGEGVETVGEYAFCPGGSGNGFTRCKDFYFPKLDYVKRGAFEDWSTVVLPSTVTTIGENAFKFVLELYYNGSAAGAPWGAYNHYTSVQN